MTNEKWNEIVWKFSKAVQRGATTAEMLRSETKTAEEKEVLEAIEKRFGARKFLKSINTYGRTGIFTSLLDMLKKVP